jgi:HEPN domain-containing protein
MKKITRDWLKSAESDIQIIAQIIKIENLTHQVAFHCQQAVEKSFKAIIEEYELGFVKTHSLINLFAKVENIFQFEIDEDILLLLDQLYIVSRYPGEMGLLPNGLPSMEEAKEFLTLPD